MGDFRHLSTFLKKHKWGYLFGIVLLMAVDGLQLMTPLVIGGFTDALKGGTLTPPMIGRYIFFIMAIAIGVAIGRYGWRMTIVATAKKLEHWIRNRVFGHLEKM